MWDVTYFIFLQSMNYYGLPIHSALLELSGESYLIAAPSHKGKTTCGNRIPEPWKVLCDDETLIVPDNEGFNAHPFPTWMHFINGGEFKSWDVQKGYPLKAIFFLEQSGHDEVVPVGKGKASALIFDHSLQVCESYLIDATLEDAQDQKKLMFKNACKIAEKIPCYILRATKSGRFWEEMEKVL
jgi:SynChlorMet cassette protein ScmC